METKECKVCKNEKTLNNFSKNQKSIDGLHYKCKECVKEYNKHHYQNNEESIKNYHQKWREDNFSYFKDYYQNNEEYLKGKNKDWRENNKEMFKNYQKNYSKYRLQNDPVFKFKFNVRNLIKGSFKRACNGLFPKTAKSIDILGCNFEYFIQHIQSQFTEGMTLENYGKWHLDHIIPISKAQTEEDIIKLNHYTNFQPLWAIDNLKKGNKIK